METLVKQFEISTSLVEEQRAKIDEIYQAENFKKQQLVEKFLKPALLEGDEISGSSDQYTVKRAHPNHSYLKDIFTVSASKRFGEDNHKVEVNYYTCGATNDTFEMRRLETLGDVAKLIRTQGDDLIKKLDKVAEESNVHQAEYDKLNFLTQENRKLRTAVEEEKENQFKNNILTANEIKFDRGVKIFRTATKYVFTTGLKIDRVSPTGKTVNVSFDCGSGNEFVSMKTDQLYIEIYRHRNHAKFINL